MAKSTRPVRPTRRQKGILTALHLSVDEWLVCTETENVITLYNKYTGKTISKYKPEEGFKK